MREEFYNFVTFPENWYLLLFLNLNSHIHLMEGCYFADTKSQLTT